AGSRNVFVSLPTSSFSFISSNSIFALYRKSWMIWKLEFVCEVLSLGYILRTILLKEPTVVIISSSIIFVYIVPTSRPLSNFVYPLTISSFLAWRKRRGRHRCSSTLHLLNRNTTSRWLLSHRRWIALHFLN